MRGPLHSLGADSSPNTIMMDCVEAPLLMPVPEQDLLVLVVAPNRWCSFNIPR